MPYPQFDRHALKIKPLKARRNKLNLDRDLVALDQPPSGLGADARAATADIAVRVRAARKAGRPVMLTFGAHTIKNGLAPVLIRLMENGWVTHLATNGAGIIHDWLSNHRWELPGSRLAAGHFDGPLAAITSKETADTTPSATRWFRAAALGAVGLSRSPDASGSNVSPP